MLFKARSHFGFAGGSHSPVIFDDFGRPLLSKYPILDEIRKRADRALPPKQHGLAFADGHGNETARYLYLCAALRFRPTPRITRYIHRTDIKLSKNQLPNI